MKKVIFWISVTIGGLLVIGQGCTHISEKKARKLADMEARGFCFQQGELVRIKGTDNTAIAEFTRCSDRKIWVIFTKTGENTTVPVVALEKMENE